MDGVKPPLPRTTSFNSARLVRLLAGLDIAEVAPSKQTLAERWSPWLDWTDAITLSAVLNGGPGRGTPSLEPGVATGAVAVIEALERVRAELTRSITADAVFTTGASTNEGADFSPIRRRYLAHQRAMDARIAPLRASVRATLSRSSPGLARLAALDAVLEEALHERARHLLSTLPARLEKQADRLTGAQVQSVLLAELDIRLQPVEGMIDAMHETASPTPPTRHE